MQNYFDTIDLPLYAADFDYFRIAREKWELMLARLGQLGIRTITVTTPWGFHEFAKGTIDLTGATRPRRDVAGLLELCASFKFRCLLKVGPYANNCGLLNDGLPHWLANTSNLGDTELLAATTGWFQALSKALLNQQWPDGPVVALQVEDEPSQRQQPSFSKQLTEVRWPIWLRKRYIEVEALNTAYGTSYSTVSEVPFPQDVPQETTPLAQDAQEFLAEVQAEKRAGFDQVLVETGWYAPIFFRCRSG